MFQKSFQNLVQIATIFLYYLFSITETVPNEIQWLYFNGKKMFLNSSKGPFQNLNQRLILTSKFVCSFHVMSLSSSILIFSLFPQSLSNFFDLSLSHKYFSTLVRQPVSNFYWYLKLFWSGTNFNPFSYNWLYLL